MTKKTIPNDILLGEATDMLSRGIEVIIMTKGNSMLPFIKGEIDSVRLKKLETVSEGDIVLARIDGKRYVLHRVICVDGEKLTLMGDGNLLGREYCGTSDVSGTVMEIIGPDDKGRTPGKAIIWRRLLPIRRYLLAIYRRLVLRKYNS